MGPSGSATWHLMLDGAEAILREEGYAELTSRRIAERVGIKQQLVYYYFKTMDDLMVEAFRRLSKRELERFEQAMAADCPLHEIWGIAINTNDARLISEFMALANRSEGVKTEVVAFIEQSRRLQVAALTRAIERKAAKAGKAGKSVAALPPVAATFLATSVGLALTREAALGVSMGHAEIAAVVEQFLSALEP
jgi:AcrR family transcriptional regulator